MLSKCIQNIRNDYKCNVEKQKNYINHSEITYRITVGRYSTFR